MKRNITVQLDESVIKKAKVVAAARSTSVSRLVAVEIERVAVTDHKYQAAKRQALKHFKQFSIDTSGKKLPGRDSLHER